MAILHYILVWPILWWGILVPVAAQSQIAIVSATSSNGYYASPPYPPSYAIDGVVGNSVSATPNTCFHSAIGTASLSPALTLDLGATYTVAKVVLWPRTECCTNPRNLYWELYIGDSLSLQSNTACAMPFNVTPSPAAPSFGKGPAYEPFNTTVYCSAVGRYVILTRPYRADSPSNNFLQVCEVKVFAATPSQTSSTSLSASGSASATASPSRTASQSSSSSGSPSQTSSASGSPSETPSSTSSPTQLTTRSQTSTLSVHGPPCLYGTTQGHAFGNTLVLAPCTSSASVGASCARRS